MKVETTGDGLRAVDAAKNSLTVRTDGWSGSGSGPSLEEGLSALGLSDIRSPDVVVFGRTTCLSFPPVYSTVTDIDTGERYRLGSGTGPLELGAGSYVTHVDSRVDAYVRFDGAATLTKPGYERLRLEFPEETHIAIGFSTDIGEGPATVTVPRSPAGVARALSAFPSAHRTATADRSFATMRGEPPRIAFGEEVSIPASVDETHAASDVHVVVPEDLSYLFTVSPFAHYVGADVGVESGTTPRLATPEGTRELPTGEEFQAECAALLERTFYLDCLVRNAGPYSSNLSLLPVLEELELDAEDLYAASPGERLSAYLSVPFESVSERFPEWHLSMSIEPSYEHAPTLSYLLANVPHVAVAKSTTLGQAEWLDKSLDDFYRGEGAGDVASVDLVQPTLGRGRTHGWLANGIPINAFKALPEAYEHREKYLDGAGEPTSVVAILNDSGMREEHAEVARRYRDRAKELDLDITLRENLTADELARVFESRNDLVHYIGHCEREGLRCADGYLSMSSLAESNAQTFFLNACGSYHEGIELVRKGSVAGGVTFNEVLDSQAATVGTMFARLMVNGYCIERALDKSRRRIMTGKDYAVVGDGTHVLTHTEDFVCPDVELEELGEDRYRVTITIGAPWMTGGHFVPYLQEDDTSHLLGSTAVFEVDRQRLLHFLSYADNPILYEGDLQWSDAISAQL